MKIGQKIEIDKAVYKVVFISECEIKLQKTNNSIVWGLHRDATKGIKLIGWKEYQPYNLINKN